MNTNTLNMIIGFSGFLLANAPQVFENMNHVMTVVSWILGSVMLIISIFTGLVNYRIKKIEEEEKRLNLEKKRGGSDN